ncbi:S8 family serine peptidase [Anaerobacillus sp. HL2]|nr:S8 family serine peptidase [Anaerobacillus sp. HL2]
MKRIDPIQTYEVTLDESVPFIGGDHMRGRFDDKGNCLTGKGIKIAVIDTGIDYGHPDLKENYKGGYDVIDCDEDPMETTKEQGLSTIHGTCSWNHSHCQWQNKRSGSRSRNICLQSFRSRRKRHDRASD